MTPTEEILDRYKRREKVTDKLGRVIEMRVLKPSQNMAVLRMLETEHNGVLSNYLVAASVYMVDDAIFTFPKRLIDMDLVMDKLGREGMSAATAAFVKLNGLDKKQGEDEAVEPETPDA